MFVNPFRDHSPLTFSFPGRLVPGRRRSPATFRPQVEALEARLAPAITLMFHNQNPAYNYNNIYAEFLSGSNFNATVGGTGLALNTPYTLQYLNNGGQGTTLNSYIGGRIYFSLGQPLDTSDLHGGLPDPANPSLKSSQQRWDYIEPTYDGSPSSTVDLTAIDAFSVPLKLQDGAGTRMYNISGGSMFSQLGALSNNDPTVVLKDGGNVFRVLGPSKVSGPYPSFAGYISAVFTWQNGTAHKTEIKGHYNGIASPPSNAYQPQDYDFFGTVDASGNLTLQGSGTAAGTHTLTITATNLRTGIYGANPFYSIDGGPQVLNSNSVYDAVIRDILGGFNLGFVDSTTIDPKSSPATAFGDEPSNMWFQSNQFFNFLQPTAPPSGQTFYNPWAKVVFDNSNAYGFPYSDLLTSLPAPVLLPLPTGDTLQITVQADNPFAASNIPTVTPFSSAESDTTLFPVQWSAPGTVDVKSFDVYVSQDNGPFTLWQNQTTATSAFFSGQANSTYGFYAVATDVFGNTSPTPAQAQATILVQDPHVDYVSQIYQVLLHRAADAPGLGQWVAFLDQGGSRQVVAQEIAASPEGRGIQVDGFYQQFLHRAADAAGRAGWVNALLAGVSVTTVEVGFLTSAEYLQAHAGANACVSGLYQDILGRPGTATELAPWVNAITAGGPLAQAVVALGILTSAEAYEDFISQVYETALGRVPDPVGLDGWVAALVHRQIATDQAAAMILSSDEAYLYALQQ